MIGTQDDDLLTEREELASQVAVHRKNNSNSCMVKPGIYSINEVVDL